MYVVARIVCGGAPCKCEGLAFRFLGTETVLVDDPSRWRPVRRTRTPRNAFAETRGTAPLDYLESLESEIDAKVAVERSRLIVTMEVVRNPEVERAYLGE